MEIEWTVEQVEDGFQVYLDGEPWVANPKATREEAEAYVERLRLRYGADSARVLMPEDGQHDSGHKRGGPWRYSYPTDDGEETGVIHTSRLQDAKQVLRTELERKRLPNGIEWEIEI